MSTFHERLKSLRENKKDINKKWTQKYVADKVGVARETYTGYERGTKTPPIETINRIADLFEVTTDYLTGRSDNPKLTKEEVDQETKEFMDLLKQLPEEEKKEFIKYFKAHVEISTRAKEED